MSLPHNLRQFGMLVVIIMAFIGCQSEDKSPPPAENIDSAEGNSGGSNSASARGMAVIGPWGVALEDRDLRVAPGDDFYRYVNGGWLQSYQMADEFSSYGALTMVRDQSEAQIIAIILSATNTPAKAGQTTQVVGDAYFSYSNADAIEARGLVPVEKFFSVYDKLINHTDVALVMAQPGMAFLQPFSIRIDDDARRPGLYVPYIEQAGLGMPVRDYYLQPEYAQIADQYQKFLAEMLTLENPENANQRAKDVYALELNLAKAHWSRAKRSTSALTYNRLTPQELKIFAPNFPWSAFLEARKFGAASHFILQENTAIKASADIFAQTPVAVWQDYFIVRTLSEYADVLPETVRSIHFEFYQRTLKGNYTQRSRQQNALANTNQDLSEAVGALYAQRYFPQSSQQQIDALVENLIATFADHLKTVPWMSAPAKQAALTKLSALKVHIGAPKTALDYASLQIRREDAFGNQRRIRIFNQEKQRMRLEQFGAAPHWSMATQTVGAQYAPRQNTITFPAAFLQAPFFDTAADPAVNYGAIGAVIGHELSHGFDSLGRQSDARGMAQNWWTKEDVKAFQDLEQALITQYQQYPSFSGPHAPAVMAISENIGDLGGLRLAYDAYHLSLGGQPAPILDGLTGDQRFFIAWAQTWKRLYRDQERARRAVTTTHAPADYRCNGVVRNMGAWYDAFDVQPDDALYLPPNKRISVW